MQCSKCDSEVRLGVNLCAVCGADQRTAEPPSLSRPSPIQADSPRPVGAVPPRWRTPTAESHSRRWIIVVGVIVAALVVGTSLHFRSRRLPSIAGVMLDPADAPPPPPPSVSTPVDPDWLNALRTKADQGDILAQLTLGENYAKGNGVAKNWAEAVKWYRRSADQGNAQAQLGLGTCYLWGWGLQRDEPEGVKWFRKAADQENAEAQHQLYFCYFQGLGVPQDYAEAVKWERMAAMQGHAKAQYELGGDYSAGLGVPEDFVEAYAWYVLAAENGDRGAPSLRDVLEKNLYPQALVQAKERTRELRAEIQARKEHL